MEISIRFLLLALWVATSSYIGYISGGLLGRRVRSQLAGIATVYLLLAGFLLVVMTFFLLFSILHWRMEYIVWTALFWAGLIREVLNRQ